MRILPFLPVLLTVGFSASAAEHAVVIGPGLVYTPSVLEIAPGDTVRFTARQDHPLESDDDLFSCLEECSVRFDAPGDYGFHCQIHGGPGTGMAGRIRVQGTAPEFVADSRVTGTWFDPQTPGQGLSIEVLADGSQIALGWFTWRADAPGQHDWLSALGPVDGDSASFALHRSAGGRFAQPDPVTSIVVGSATLRFDDCDSARLEWQRDDLGRSGSIALRRLAPPPAACAKAVRLSPR